MVCSRELDLYFQSQTCSSYAFAIKITQAADVPDSSASTCTATAAEMFWFNFSDAAHVLHLTKYSEFVKL